MAKLDQLAKGKKKEEPSKEIAKKEETAVATNQLPYAVALLTEMKKNFVAANAGLGLDFVYMGQWLVVNKKGNFVERDDDSVNYGDAIDVVIGMGEERFVLWGKQNTKEVGTLIIAEQTLEEAKAKFDELEHTLTPNEYDYSDIQSRYLASVIPVETLKEDTPKVYLLSFAQTAKIAYGKWALGMYNGKYEKQGIPRGTSVPMVITTITTVEKKTDDFSYITMEFDAKGLFDPADFNK